MYGGGALLLGLGVAGAVDLYQQGKRAQDAARDVQGTTISPSPASLSGSAQQALSVLISWRNPGSAAITYGIQGVLVEEADAATGNGVVAGHLFTSAADAQDAEGGQLALVTDPSARVAFVHVAAGASGSATLYGVANPSEVVPPFGIVVWIVPYAAQGQLLGADPTKATVSRLAIPGGHFVPLGSG
jgi:hypothetical protein